MRFMPLSPSHCPNAGDSIGRTARRAFTLIELLVVIAIIALLAAILFPVFGRARENARRSSCQSNLKQIALGVKQYQQDYDERFPAIPTGAFTQDSGPWAFQIYPYLKSEQIFQCPSDTSSVPDPVALPALYNRSITAGFSDYYINYNLGENSGTGVVESALTGTSNTILFGEATSANGGAANWSASGGMKAGSGTVANSRHLEGANYAFADGHVKWMLPERLTSGASNCSGQANSPNGTNATFCIN